MNSYPPELLTQLAPIMFVAGLDVPNATPPANSPPQIPITPQSPQTPRSQDPFSSLIIRLREALSAQRKLAIWQPQTDSKSFHVVLVDRQFRFPPRKIVPPNDPQSTARSPLSPLTPTSPLYPDGLIAPIWIRKHTTLVPSVFVLFLRLYEYPPSGSRSPLDGPDADREREERSKDTELSAEIAQRKKAMTERGIKLTVVLMASRRMLDDPTLDSRLTFIRRQSGLDSRAALFVLSPVSPAELIEFTKSLQQALYESALEYYISHSKRVRRKRNRHSQAAHYSNPIASPVGTPSSRPLRPEGWTVRYEYKMACFAEFRGEDEVALKHFQDAYSALVIMFGSTMMLPPRTKRWAEAKVLADCIDFKVCKLYLYNNEHSLALSQHSAHMKRFGDLSRGWGIGEETYEYWSWMARQHRILAELLEQGLRFSLKLPTHAPLPPAPVSQSQSTAPPARGLEAEVLRGLNPSHALQHPGFYYYMAARCTEARRNRFLDAVQDEIHAMSAAPGFANEKKVDHLTIILELFTKAYEHFKKFSTTSQGQGRLTLWIAYRIAQTYHDAGKFDMAVRFFERIAKTYRREKWGLILRPILTIWYACAQQLGDVELSVKLLVEMMGHGQSENDESAALEEDLLAVLQSTVPSSDEVLTVDLSEASPIFNTNAVFWNPEVKVRDTVAFQIWITAPTDVNVSSLPFASLSIHFPDDLHPPIVVRHSEAHSPEGGAVQRVDLGNLVTQSSSEATEPVELRASLRWATGALLVLVGTVTSHTPVSFSIFKLVLNLRQNAWNIDIPLEPSNTRADSLPTYRWLCSIDPIKTIDRPNTNLVKFIHRPHEILLSFTHQDPAYVDEEYPIIIDVTNTDDRDLDIIVDVLLQPSEIDDAVNSMTLDDQQSTSLVKGVNFGVIRPGESTQKTLYLLGSGAEGDRTLDISVQSRTITEGSEDIDVQTEDATIERPPAEITETLRTLTISTVHPFKRSSTVEYSRSLKEKVSIADLDAFEPGFWDGGEGGEATVTTTLECAGPWKVEVQGMKLIKKDGQHAKIVSSSCDEASEDAFPTVLEAGDVLCELCRVGISSDLDLQDPIPTPGEYEVQWRRVSDDSTGGSVFITRIPMPMLQPPMDGAIAILNVSPIAKLHQPFLVSLSVRNNHPSRSANVTVHIDPDPSDGFIFSGLRNGRIPILLPQAEETLTWNMIPIECGNVRIPKINVIDRRKGTVAGQVEGDSVEKVIPIVDARYDRRHSPAAEAGDSNPQEQTIQEKDKLAFHVMILP